jgi:RNA polymerase sigma-70 factor (ECF subfamily)
VQNEESLVERAKQRDQEAFAQLYEEYFDRIYRYIVFKIGDEMEAEDMTQQVFLKVLRSISSFRWKGVSFSAWLYRIAHNQVVDYLRRKAKRGVVPLNELIVSGGDDPQRVTEQHADIEQVLAAAKHLTEAQREVVSLRFAGDLSIAEVAKAMGRSEGAIKALQHSAIVALRKAMAY